jgi:predicted nucleic acid-binding protein
VIVVDTNIIVHYWLKSELNSNAERLLVGDPKWIAPFLWRSEFRNVLSFYIKRKLLDNETAYRIIELAEKQFTGNEYLVDSKGVVKLSNDSGCSAYDCEFIFLAKEFSVKLCTTDKQIIKSFPDLTIHLSEF